MTVFSSIRTMESPVIELPPSLKLNKRQKMNGLNFLSKIQDDQIPTCFFDPQYRGVYEKMGYGNEDTSRNYQRVMIPQMNDEMIKKFVNEIARVLMPSGHLFLWLDKFHLCTNFQEWFDGTTLEPVDMITWNKQRMGLGYRARHQSEFLMILQKIPKRAKGVWALHDIPDVWGEKIPTQKTYHHTKPIGLQSKLIECVTNKGDIVIDPASGSYSVKTSCENTNRTFLGCDIR